jgi:urease accessory protein
MPRATSVLAASLRDNRTADDTVILDFAQRGSAEGAVTSVKGRIIEIDLHAPMRLRTDDLLLFDDGTNVEVVAAPEALIEVRGGDLAALARIAWHLGDRHIAAELLPNRIRARRDPTVEKLLASLGAKVTVIDAPFEPEGGAYVPAHHAHDHNHHHDDGHRHD